MQVQSMSAYKTFITILHNNNIRSFSLQQQQTGTKRKTYPFPGKSTFQLVLEYQQCHLCLEYPGIETFCPHQGTWDEHS